MTIYTKQGTRIAEMNMEKYEELTNSWKKANTDLKNGVKPLIHGVYKYIFWNKKAHCWDVISVEKQKHIALLQGESFKNKEYALQWLSGGEDVKTLKEKDIHTAVRRKAYYD